MYIKLFEHISYEEVEGVLISLDAKLNNESQLQSLAGSSQNGPSMHDAKSSMVKLLFNDFWIEYVLMSYLFEHHMNDHEKMDAIEFFKTNTGKNKSNFSVEHIKGGQINVFLSDKSDIESFKNDNVKALQMCLLATNQSINTVIHEDKLFNTVYSIASAGCNKSNQRLDLEPGFEWLNELPDVYDLAQWLVDYLSDSNMTDKYKSIAMLLEYVAKSKMSPIVDHTKPQVTPDNKLNRVHDQSITTNALISTAFKLNLSEMLMEK